MKLGRGGLLGLDAAQNAARQDADERPPQSKSRSSRSALGAVSPVFGALAGGVQGQSSIAEPAEPRPPYKKPWESL